MSADGLTFPPAPPEPLALGPTTALDLADVYSVAVDRRPVALVERPTADAGAAASLDPVYGLTTGFGPLSGHSVPAGAAPQHQTRLIAHLATGVGAPLGLQEARALMLVRLATLAQGRSRVSPALPALMAALLNAGLAPEIPEKGTVGASGDLTPSAHMALALTGQGAFFDADGQRLAGTRAFDRLGLAPARLEGRDGLALVNGTAAMTGIGALTLFEARRLAVHALTGAAVFAVLMNARREAYSALISDRRPHPGQRRAQRWLTELLPAPAPDPKLPPRATAVLPSASDAGTPMQDAYSLRCLPQAFGAVFDFLDHASRTVIVELASVTDNPLFDDDGRAVHGGNFYGQHVAFAMDQAALCLTKLGLILERQLAWLVDARRNGGLPPFLAGGRPGETSGFMGAQVTASSLLAEMRAQLGRASVQSVPTNGDNQDINTMGTLAARQCRGILADAWALTAIHAAALRQALHLRPAAAAAVAGSAPLHRWLAAVALRICPVRDDRPLSDEIRDLAEHLRRCDPVFSAGRRWQTQPPRTDEP